VYFGSASPAAYGIKANIHTSFLKHFSNELVPYQAGVYCISATTLQGFPARFFGQWCRAYERLYNIARRVEEQYEATENDAKARAGFVGEVGGEERMQRVLDNYEELRLGRLCAFLRERNPDAMIGYSILIYRLSAGEIEKALNGPIFLHDTPEVKGAGDWNLKPTIENTAP
jgi:hypothetical protein